MINLPELMNGEYKPGRFFFFGICIILSIIIADQYSKWLVIETMLKVGGETPDFLKWFTTFDKRNPLDYEPDVFKTIAITPFLNFVMVWNQGVSFGLFNSEDPRVAFILIAVALLISMMLLIWLALAHGRRLAWGISLVIGGAISNVIDRVRFGAVADFIDVYAGKYHWPAFNLADSCIVIGALILAIDAFMWPSENKIRKEK